jgi:hypothetical protein
LGVTVGVLRGHKQILPGSFHSRGQNHSMFLKRPYLAKMTTAAALSRFCPSVEPTLKAKLEHEIAYDR